MKRMILFLILILTLLAAQDLTSYYDMLESGNLSGVRNALPRLRRQYPGSPEVMYLSALVESDGEEAFRMFGEVFSRYPKSDRADDALLKIIEYLYTKGLYNKTVRYAKRMIDRFPQSDLLNPCAQMLFASYQVMGERDSIDYYYDRYRLRIPNFDPKYSNYEIQSQFKIVEKPASQPDLVSAREHSSAAPQAPTPAPQPVAPPSEGQRYGIQLGAFSQTANAMLLKDQLEGFGYDPYLQKIGTAEKTLTAVRVGRFATRAEAVQLGEDLKSRYGYEYYVVRP